MSVSKNINSEVREYINSFEARKSDFVGKKTDTGIAKGKGYYDILSIKETVFSGCIKPNIDGLTAGEKSETYLDYVAVVFDDRTYNFHIFPSHKKTCEILSNEFTELRNNIIDILINKGLCATRSGSGDFKRFDNIQIACKKEERFGKNIYRFVEIEKNNVSYSINFMRYTCDDEKGMVGCTMRAVQFHKARMGGKNKGYINYGENDAFSICYTKTDADGEKRSNDAGNICYNPPVDYPFIDLGAEERKKRISSIVEEFIDFIEREDKKTNM